MPPTPGGRFTRRHIYVVKAFWINQSIIRAQARLRQYISQLGYQKKKKGIVVTILTDRVHALSLSLSTQDVNIAPAKISTSYSPGGQVPCMIERRKERKIIEEQSKKQSREGTMGRFRLNPPSSALFLLLLFSLLLFLPSIFSFDTRSSRVHPSENALRFPGKKRENKKELEECSLSLISGQTGSLLAFFILIKLSVVICTGNAACRSQSSRFAAANFCYLSSFLNPFVIEKLSSFHWAKR